MEEFDEVTARRQANADAEDPAPIWEEIDARWRAKLAEIALELERKRRGLNTTE